MSCKSTIPLPTWQFLHVSGGNDIYVICLWSLKQHLQKWRCKPDRWSSCELLSSHDQNFLVELLFNCLAHFPSNDSNSQANSTTFSSLILQNMHLPFMQNRRIPKSSFQIQFLNFTHKILFTFQRLLNLKFKSDSSGIALSWFIYQISTLDN